MAEGEELGSNLLRVNHSSLAETGGFGSFREGGSRFGALRTYSPCSPGSARETAVTPDIPPAPRRPANRVAQRGQAQYTPQRIGPRLTAITLLGGMSKKQVCETCRVGDGQVAMMRRVANAFKEPGPMKDQGTYCACGGSGSGL